MLSEWDTHIKKTCCDSATNLTSKHPKDIPSHSWESSKPGVCITKTTFKKLFIWLCWVLGAAWGMWDLYGTFSCGMPTLSCGMWDLVPRAGIELGAPALGAWSLSHWTIREVLRMTFNHYNFLALCYSLGEATLRITYPSLSFKWGGRR